MPSYCLYGKCASIGLLVFKCRPKPEHEHSKKNSSQRLDLYILQYQMEPQMTFIGELALFFRDSHCLYHWHLRVVGCTGQLQIQRPPSQLPCTENKQASKQENFKSFLQIHKYGMK